ncbi:MAG: iron-containing alcohol dehydrogenase [Bacilli bacterium]|nr:iron-containing alcohol dehydrogenase [Bacilli bacterium]
MNKIFIRLFQVFSNQLVKLIKWEDPLVLSGEKTLNKLPKMLKEQKIVNVFVIVDPNIYRLGLSDAFLDGLKEVGINYELYTEVKNNPTIESIEKTLTSYQKKVFDLTIVIGGGSAIDTAKLTLIVAENKGKKLKQLRGYFKVRKRIPPLIAVPTTAGSGSEVTIAAVVTNDETHEKYAITSPKILPRMVVLDPNLTINLPPSITAYTGMDALVHAIECYIGKANTKYTKKISLEAIKIIWNNLRIAVEDGKNTDARNKMLEASFKAGCAFTRGFVGYVHAISHQLSGFYNIPHGLANAVILPKVLEQYGKAINKDMYKIYKALGYQDNLSMDEARCFIINEIYKMNNSLNIPKKFEGVLEKDIETMVKRCMKEAHPMYPVPKILSKKSLINIYKEMI